MSDYCSEVEATKHNASRPPPIALGINVEKPKFPQYAVYSKRLESFKEWPDYLPIDKNDLVEAGLVYTGVGDSVRCYFCGGGLRNWEQGDVPMEEHANWYTNCPLVKGKAYVERLARGEKPEDPEKNNQQDNVDTIDYTNSVAAQSCIEMGYSEQMVRKAIYIFIDRNGNKDFEGADLCKILFDIEENPERFDGRSVCTEDVKQTADEQETPFVGEEKHGVGDRTRCHLCGGGLGYWEQNDIPVEEHAKRHTNCPHSLLVKGQDSVERLGRGVKQEDPGTSSQQDSVNAIDYMKNVAAKRCIEMGCSEQMVRKAIGIFLRRSSNVNKDFKETDLFEIISDLAENFEKTDERSVCTEDVKHAADGQETPSVEEEQHGPLETLLEENNRLEENQMCKISFCNVM